MWSSLFTPLSILLITTFVSGLSKNNVDGQNDESWTVTVTRTSYTTICPCTTASLSLPTGLTAFPTSAGFEYSSGPLATVTGSSHPSGATSLVSGELGTASTYSHSLTSHSTIPSQSSVFSSSAVNRNSSSKHHHTHAHTGTSIPSQPGHPSGSISHSSSHILPSTSSVTSISSHPGHPSGSVSRSSSRILPSTSSATHGSHSLSSISLSQTTSSSTSTNLSGSLQPSASSSAIVRPSSSARVNPSQTVQSSSGVRSSPSATQTPLVLYVEPSQLTRKRQTYNTAVLIGSGYVTASCSDADVFHVDGTSLYDGDLLVSTDAGVSQIQFVGSQTPGAITGTFSVVNGILTWTNAAFPAGQAQFCVMDSTVYAVFDTGLPSGCTQVTITAVPYCKLIYGVPRILC